MSKGTTALERLGNPRRCTAHKKRTHEPCSAWAIKGGTVCRVHGGMAKQVQAKAKVRLDLGVVRDAVRRLRGDEPAPHAPLPTPATEVEQPPDLPDTPLVAEVPVPQPDLPVPEPNPEPPKQTAAPLMGLTEATTQAGQGNRQARVRRPRPRRR